MYTEPVHNTSVNQTSLHYRFAQELNKKVITLTDITRERNVQGTDITWERNVKDTDITSQRNIQGLDITCGRNVQVFAMDIT